MIHLVLGGARSGKSRYGEILAARLFEQGYVCHYVATAQALDEEMRARITRHQHERHVSSLSWQLHEHPLQLADCLHQLAPQLTDSCVVLVDCLTLWLTNELLRPSPDWPAQKQALLACLATLPGQIILISNEVGSGIVPMGELSRQFVDEAGWLNQAVAALADDVTLVVAGLPLVLKRAAQ